MGVWSFIRNVFNREQKSLEAAAAGVPVGSLPYDISGKHAGNYSEDGFIGAHSNSSIDANLRMDNALVSRFVDYERMDESSSECSSGLDIYSDDSTITDIRQKHVLWVECNDNIIKTDLDKMFWRKLKVDSEAWETIRTLCKYGNSAAEILLSGQGVEGLNFLPVPTVRRVEHPGTGQLKGYVQSFKGNFQISVNELNDIQFEKGVGKHNSSGVVLFEPWRMTFMRLRGSSQRSQYGRSILEPARWVWKRLMLLEDASLISRLSRAPSRFAFYVDVGKMPPEQAEKHLGKVRQAMKKKSFVDPTTGTLNMKFNPLSVDEDFYFPVRDSRELTRADVLNTPQWTGMDDIEYFQKKIFAAIKIPRAYLGYDENMPSRATLSAEDVRFAKSVLRIQNEFRSGMKHVADVHLASKGIDPAYVEYDVKMTVPSAIFELAQLETENVKAQFAQTMEMFVSKQWILSKVFGLADDEISTIFEQRKKESAIAEGGGRFESYEMDMTQGNKEHEKQAEEQLDKILSENRHLSQNIRSLHSLMHDIRQVVTSRA